MRIISGTWKGWKLNPPAGIEARPTTDRAKEGLFQWLIYQDLITDSKVLDLFCGSGSVSLEFLSNGAASVTSVDKSNTSLRFLQQVRKEKQAENWEIIKGDVFRFLEAPAPEPAFHLIFADPPYQLSLIPKLPALLLDNNWLQPGGLFILEHQHLLKTPELRRIAQKQYGISTFSIYQA